jgi:hypothetical protein
MRTVLKKGDLTVYNQFSTPGIIEAGDQFRLMVGTRPKIGTICFIPDFKNWDHMVGGDKDTSRFFIPVKYGEVTDQTKILSDMKPGEIYEIRILDWNIHHYRKTRDGRIMMFLNIEILSRVESVTDQIDREKSVFIKSVYSGKVLVSQQYIPVKLEKKDMIQNGRVYRFIVAMDGDKIIGWEFDSFLGGSISDYARYLAETAKISNKMALAAVKKLPDVKSLKAEQKQEFCL